MAYPIDDVVVVLPGIMGSTLWRDGSPVWEPSRGGVVEALTSLFRSVTTLRLPDGVGDEHPGDGVEPLALMPDVRLPFGVWTFDLGYDALLAFLRDRFELTEADPGREHPANLVVFPYDWRLSNRYNGELLRTMVEPALARWRDQGGPSADAKLVFIAHSMGGLVARWYLDHLGGAEVTRKVITLGTPHRGAARALDQLCNGVRKGVGPFKLNLTRFARSLPSMHQLLPEYACIETATGLVKTTETKVPELVTAMVRDAMDFHTQIDTGRTKGPAGGGYDLHNICGFRQPTSTTVRLDRGRVVGLDTIDGEDQGGDATVPRLGAAPPDLGQDSPSIHHVADNHGGLVHNRSVFDEIEGILTASRVRYRGDSVDLTVNVAEVLDPGEPLTIRAVAAGGERVVLEALATGVEGRPLDVVRLRTGDRVQVADLANPGPGVFQVTVRGAGTDVSRVSPVTTAVLSWPPESSFDLVDATSADD